MARLLVTADYGGVTLAIAVLGLTRLVAMLGIQTGVSRLYPVYEDESAKARGVVRAAYRISTVAGLVVAVGLFDPGSRSGRTPSRACETPRRSRCGCRPSPTRRPRSHPA